MAKGFLKILKIIIHFENWPARIAELLHCAPKDRLMKLKVRGGPVFYVRPYSSDASCLQSITRDGEYFRYWNVMPGDTVVDIGANIGSFSVFVADREPTARVIAVEPLQMNVDLLQKNIDANRLGNVTVVRAGVSDATGTATIYHGKGTWHASGSLFAIDAVRKENAEQVPCMTLHELFSAHRIERCDFLKMDCEGAEYKILWNIGDDLWSRVSKIALEFHNFDPGKTPEDIMTLLRTKGFRAILPQKYARKEIGLIFASR